MLDWLVEGGKLVDGTGNAWRYADLGLLGDRIVSIGLGQSLSAKHHLDAQGLVVAPGVIDSHTHSELYALARPEGSLAKLAQGVTTEIMGLCGLSAFPVVEDREMLLRAYLAGSLAGEELAWRWHGYADLAARIEHHELLTNFGSMIGHGSVRLAVVGSAQRPASPQEIERMQALVTIGLEEGALGVSFGLVYPPGCFAERRELVALASVAARMGRPCAAHIRDEGDRLLESVQEAIEIARESGCRMVISHLKAAGRANWGQVHEALERIEGARIEGLDIRTDVYPYTAGCPLVTSLLPRWVHDGGLSAMLNRLEDPQCRKRIASELETGEEWENLVRLAGWDGILILGYSPEPAYVGQSLASISQVTGKEPAAVLMDLILESQASAVVGVFDLSQEDVDTVVTHPLSMIISDNVPSPGLDHPRLHGSFARVLAHYVREKKLLSLEEAIRKMTSYVAQTYNLADRGLLKPGMRADVFLFDPQTIVDRASYRIPNQYPDGIRAVFVAGQKVFQDGQLTGVRSGEMVLI